MRRGGTVVAAAVMVAASMVWISAAPSSMASSAQQQGPARRLTLTGQSPYVVPGGEFVVRVRLDRAGSPTPTDVVVTVYGPVETRSEFAETLRDRISRTPVTSRSFAVGSLNAEATGDVALPVPLGLEGDDGVYPVRVELRDRTGTALERFVTHLIYLGGSHTGPKLGVSLVLPVRSSISLPSDGSREEPHLDELVPGIAALEAHRSLPFAFLPAPETIAALDAADDERADRAVEALRRIAADHLVIGTTFVPVSPPHLLGPGLGDELTAQIQRGTDVIDDVLHVNPQVRTWVASEPLDPESIDDLVLRRGVERMVVSDTVLEPVPDLELTLTRPFVLGGRESDVPAVVADAELAAHFNGEPNQVLQAHRLLADLAVLWLDSPASSRRAVVAMAPPDWRASRGFLDTLVNGLAQNPIAEAVPLDTVFGSIAPAITSRGSALVRHPADLPPGGFAELAGDIRQARRRLSSLGSVLVEPTAGLSLLQDRLLVAQSTELRSVRERQSYVAAVETGINDHLADIQMPSGRSITLTARRGQIPVTFQNRTGAPAKVVVRVQSDKLEFPGGASMPLELNRRNTTERIPVLARTSGAFPLRITLESPDGNLLIGRARLTVRSTAASRVSVAVSVGALVFLAVWWARHIARGPRAKRLIPA
jgi:hypothetical protein